MNVIRHPDWFIRQGRVRYSLLGLLSFVTVACIALGWKFRHQPYVATAYLRVRYHPTENYGADSSYSDKKNEIFCQSLLTLFKSPFVLNAALAPNTVAQLPAVLRQEDPVSWLSDNLEVSFPSGGEILEIRLAGSEAQMPDYCTLIDSVILAFKNEVLSRRRIEFAEEQEYLMLHAQEIKDTLKSKIEEASRLANEFGESGHEIHPQLTLLHAEVDLLTEHWKELKRRLLRSEIFLKKQKQSITIRQPAMSQKQ